MTTRNSYKIAFLGIVSALILVLLFLETQVLSFLPVTPCYLSLPLAIGISIYSRKIKDFIVGGLIFGIISFILSFIFGQVWFSNPLISVLPRIIFGFTAGFTLLLLKKIFCKSKSFFIKDVLPYSFAGVIGAITNTVLVVSGFLIFGFQSLREALVTIISFNALIEIVCSCVFVPVISLTARKYFYFGEN